MTVGFLAYKETGEDPLHLFDKNLKEKLTQLNEQGEGTKVILADQYAFAPTYAGHDHQVPIDIEKHNKPVSEFLSKLDASKVDLLIVPGFIPPMSGPMRTNQTSRNRLNWAVLEANKKNWPIFLLTGGNVKPDGTPFNEALEMKKYLMKNHQVPEFLIALEPYAQNTVTNLRNAGRFMLVQGIKEARVVTTLIQNLYIGFADTSTFMIRSRALLGYEVGELELIDENQTRFVPSEKVLQKSDSKVDP